jgi:hypothetical protein
MVLEIIKYLKVIFNGDLGAAKIVLKTKTNTLLCVKQFLIRNEK